MGFWSRSGKSRKKGKSIKQRRGWQPIVETLERRDLLTGTWTPLVNPVPNGDGAITQILLSDGTVMVQGGADNASNTWYALSPDASGSYINGTWSQLASSNVQRLFAPMNILPNGNVFLMGGEYSGPNTDATFNNTGEIFNPVTDKWTNIANFPQPIFGDDPTKVLPNGQVLAGFIVGPQTFFYNPANNTWTQAATKQDNDQSDEESWVKLPDGSILSYSIFASIGSGVSMAQKYIPSSNQWVEAGTITDSSGNPVQLSSDSAGDELGPALLLPDGRVIQFGSTGNTAFYDYRTNTWTQGPSIPNDLIASDDSGGVLPNGNVLIAVSPFATDSNGNFAFPPPTTIYEFNPTTGSYTDVTPTDDNLDQENAFLTTMLDLPSGQVLLTNNTGQLEVYTPDGAPQASWAPVITNIQRSGTSNSIFTLTGTQLNGLNEGSAYGDDLQMDTNFPLVRLTSLQTGAVTYARTANWSLTGVATGSTPETVNFTLPASFPAGAYTLTVVANGIPSQSRLFVLGTNNGDTVSVSSSDVTFNGVTTPYTASSISGIDVFEGNGTNSITAQSTTAGLPVNLHGGTGSDNFNIGAPGPTGVVSGIVSAVNIDGESGVDTLTINDAADATARTVTISGTQLGAASGDNLFSPGGSLALGNITNLVFNGGSGGNQINVLSTNSGESLSVFAGSGANNVFVGSNGTGAGSLSNILGPVSISGAATLTVDDSGSGTSNTVTLSNSGVTSAASNLFGSGGSLTYASVASLVINDGSGGNQIQVLGTASGTSTTINTGSGNDNIVVDSSPGSPTGNVNGILSSLVVNGMGGVNTLLVEDRNDTLAKTITITSSQVGSAVGDSLFGAGGSLTFNAIANLTVNGSSGGNHIFVQSTPTGSLSLYAGDGNNTILIGSGVTGSTVAGIVGAVTINGGAGASNSLTLDNSSSTVANVVTITPTAVGLATGDSFFPAGGGLTYSNIQSLTVDTSNATQGDQISVFPSATTTFFVNAGTPTTSPGDSLLMNLEGLTGSHLTSTGTGSGNWTFTNAQTTFFTGIETQSTLTALGGVVFQDVNGNGQQDSGDSGISGQLISLLDTNNSVIGQENTAADGTYQFFVNPGTYHIVEALPAGVIQTTPNPPSETVAFGSANITNLNFGNFTVTAISGEVYQDTNGNGALDSGEPGIQGWTVNLEDTNGNVLKSITTGANGLYSFTSLQPGTYRIREVAPAGWTQTTTNPADIVNASGINPTSANFGNFQLVSIDGKVFDDLNGDGLLNGSDSGLSGWTVDLFLNGKLDTTMTSDSNGNYSFPNLGPGTYRIRVESQTSWQSTNTPADISAQSGQNQANVNLGLFQQFSITGQAFLDSNANGALDSGENGIAGLTVFLDTNGDGKLESGEPSTTTDSNGDYTFANLGPGDYKVREVLQPGFQLTTSTPADIIGQSGLNETVNFGNFQAITISGEVFNDINGNGVKETGDVGLSGWTVFLDANGNGKLDTGELSATTDSSGDFSFTVNFVGTVQLAELPPAGWVQTTTQTPIVLQAGLVISQDIGSFQTDTITSQVFNDLDGDGTNNGGADPGRNGVQVSLYSDVNKNGVFDKGVDTLVATTTSAQVGTTAGVYSFTGIGPGAYLVVETPISGLVQTAPATPGYFSFTAQSGTNITNDNFGNLAGQAQSFLFAVYTNLFDRRIDSGGLAYWSAVLSQGVSRQLVVHQLATSAEGFTMVVNALYEEYLGRQADPAGLANGIKILSTEPPPPNFTPQQLLKDLLLGSPEYFVSQAGQSNQTFVTTMYKNVTGVAPNADQISILLGELSSGVDRGTVAAQVLRSVAGYDFVVQNYYQQILNRNADGGGLAFFVSTLQQGAHEEDVQQTLLGSDEFFSSL